MFYLRVSYREELIQGLVLARLTTLNCIDHPYPIMQTVPALITYHMLQNLAFSIGKLVKSSPTLTFICIPFLLAIT